jgi:hypothetical protein
MGHPQSRTPIQTNNMTAEAVINNRVQPKQIKATDMQIHWLKCHEAQGQFEIPWQPGKMNLVEYFTKHHAPAHHTNIRSEFLTRVKDRAEARSRQATKGQLKPTNQGNPSYKGVLNLLYKCTYSKPTIG